MFIAVKKNTNGIDDIITNGQSKGQVWRKLVQMNLNPEEYEILYIEGTDGNSN